MLQKRISDTIHSLTALAKNPLFLDTLIIDEVIAFYRDAIKRHRAQLLALVSFSVPQMCPKALASSRSAPFILEKHDALIANNLCQNDDEFNSTDLSIKLEELSTQWRTILRDIQDMQAHIHQLRSVADSRSSRKEEGASGPHLHANHHKHTRQKSSDVFGPPAEEILQLQLSTCDFWARCVNMYLERTTNRIKNSVRALLAPNKDIPC